MKTQECHLQKRTSIFGAVCFAMMFAFLAFGQDQPPQQNQQPPIRRMQQPAAGFPGLPENQGPRMRGPNGPGMAPGNLENGPGNFVADLFRPEIQKELNITAEQRQKLDDIRFNSEKEAIQNRASLQVHRLELSRLVDSVNPDRAAIDKKIQETAQDEASLMRSSINSRLDARGVLTAEQRAKLAQFMQNRQKMGRPPADNAMPLRRPAPNAAPARVKPPIPIAPAKPQAQ